MYKWMLILLVIVTACTPTDTATDEPTEESTTEITETEETDAASESLDFEPGDTVILIVDEFGMNFDAMSEVVLETERNLITNNYIEPLINGDVVYDLDIPRDDDTSEMMAQQEGDIQFTELLDTYLSNEDVTRTVRAVLSENIFPVDDTQQQMQMSDATEEATPETTLEAFSANGQNCAVNSEGQGIFITQGTGIFITQGTTAFTPGTTTFSSEGQGIFITQGTGIFITQGTGIFITQGTGAAATDVPSHGERVRAVAESLVDTYGNNLPIEIVNVPVEGYLMSNVAGAIEQAIQENGTDKHYVINMSFAVIPCENMETLLKYDALLRGINGANIDNENQEQLVNSLDALQALTYSLTTSGVYTETPDSGDALLAFSEENCNSDGCAIENNAPENNRVVFVGAAGNGALTPNNSGTTTSTFPYYPAAWDRVISISATDDTADFVVSEPRAAWSNPGLHMLPGIWRTGDVVEVPFQEEDSEDEVMREVEIVEVGTSFAAPRYSVLAALQLAGSQDTICGLDMQTDFRIPLSDSWLPNPPSTANIEVCP